MTMNIAIETFGDPDAGSVFRLSPASSVVERAAQVQADARVSVLEDAFASNWGRLSQAFGMDANTGRCHGLIYVSAEPVSQRVLAHRLGLGRSECAAKVQELLDWGAITEQGTDNCGAAVYGSAPDPWSWFLRIIGRRHHQEFMPLLSSMRETLEIARTLRGSSGGRASRAVARVEQFTAFVEELSRLIEVFARVGAGPMNKAVKLVARFVR